MTAAPGPQQPDEVRAVLDELAAERRRQTAKHGDQSHLPDGTGPRSDLLGDLVWWMEERGAEPDNTALAAWAKCRTKAASQNEGGDGSITFEHILTEEFCEAMAEDDPAKLRAELVQVAAVAVQWVEAIDRRTRPAAPSAQPDERRCTCPEDEAGRAATYTCRMGTEPHSVGCPRWGTPAQPVRDTGEGRR